MCGRYYLERVFTSVSLAEEMRHAVEVSNRLSANMKTEGEIRPTDIAPVIAPSRADRSPNAYPMQWGFIHPRRGMLVFNTRSETACEKAMFADSINDRRCLIPVSCYYEWKKTGDGRKEKYAFYAEDRETLYLAGLYVLTPTEKGLPCFTILTQDADKRIKELHPRMPVLIPRLRAEEWLSPETDFNGIIRELSVNVTAEPAFTPA